VIVFPNAKINLGLNIIRKRADGFHDIETVFYPVDCRDALELIPQKNNDSAFEFSITGLPVDDPMQNNLCVKAYELIKKDHPQVPAVKIHLHKAIPIGAGLGGGSADAAFMLQLLNDNFKLNLSTSQLLGYAIQLGSDCPFFILNKPCFATGRGEVLEDITLDLTAYEIVLVNPGIHINTGWAFSQASPSLPEKNIKEIIVQPVEKWKAELTNDFEEAVFSANPAIKNIKEELYRQGAVYASMSGSGSTVFGIFEKNAASPVFKGKDYFIKTVN
jgi:4-diphosphocytidyl-2-C-methyl-D-erythritol kinase